MNFSFKYDFRPVGQGLFASGNIYHQGSGKIVFNWVYDCGSSDSAASVRREVDRLHREAGGRNIIDALILSHFDADHVNGIALILKKFRVRRLFLPYVQLANRLELALTETVITAGYLHFLSDPAGYMHNIGGDNLERVIYVSGGDDKDGGVPLEVEGDEPPDFTNNGFEEIDQFTRYPDNDESLTPQSHELNDRQGHMSQDRLGVVGHNVPLSISGLWEFVFYNLKLPEVDQKLKNRVQKFIDEYVESDGSVPNPDAFILELKSIYSRQFKTSTKRNNISLITYSGPIYTSRDRHKVSGVSLSSSGALSPQSFNFNYFSHRAYLRDLRYYGDQYYETEPKLSVFYFGDFNLTKTRLQPIIQHFHPQRWKRIHATQIAHHGAKASWHENAAESFMNNFSVFSYGLHNTYKHPGKAVLNDFHLHNPVLVNELQGCFWVGELYRRYPKGLQL
jgi:hypothetical protein